MHHGFIIRVVKIGPSVCPSAPLLSLTLSCTALQSVWHGVSLTKHGILSQSAPAAKLICLLRWTSGVITMQCNHAAGSGISSAFLRGERGATPLQHTGVNYNHFNPMCILLG